MKRWLLSIISCLIGVVLFACAALYRTSARDTQTAEHTPFPSVTPVPTVQVLELTQPETTPVPTAEPVYAPRPLSAASAACALRGSQSASDVTGNGLVDAVDTEAVLMHTVGSLPDIENLPALLGDSLLGEKYLSVFSYTGTVRDGAAYKSDTICIDPVIIERDGSVCYVMDIYIRDVDSFRSALSEHKFNGKRETVLKMAKDNGALIAINGDFYSFRGNGPVVRDGVWYKETVDDRMDICVLYRDGRMITYEKGVDGETIRAAGEVWQTFVFGPMLLDSASQAMTKFHCNTSILGINPRSAVGYYEPGHYCFVLVDGRQSRYSVGMTMEELSALFFDLGCTAAYNLDGGQTAVMATSDAVVNKPFSGGRSTSDILYIADVREANGA